MPKPTTPLLTKQQPLRLDDETAKRFARACATVKRKPQEVIRSLIDAALEAYDRDGRISPLPLVIWQTAGSAPPYLQADREPVAAGEDGPLTPQVRAEVARIVVAELRRSLPKLLQAGEQAGKSGRSQDT